MTVKCVFCDTTAIARNNFVLMKCMCDDEFRTARIDDIKYGFHSDHVYLLETSTKGDKCYDQTNECKKPFYNNCR